MTRDEAVAEVQFGLGNRSDLASRIQTVLQNVQNRLEQEDRLPWFLKTEITTAATVVNEERVGLPTDFLSEWEDDALWYFNSAATEPEDEWNLLLKGENDLLRQDYPGTGEPKAYSFDGTYFRVFPKPDAVYTLKMIYYAADAALTMNIENNWLKYVPELLIGITGREVGIPLGLSSSRVGRFQELEAEGRTRLFRKNLQIEMANRQLQIGGPD